MATQPPTSKISTGLILALAVVGLFVFIPVWISVHLAPIYLVVHGLLVLGLVSLKWFDSTIKPLKFALIISGVPLALLLVLNVFIIPVYIFTNSNLGEILVVTGLTFIVCFIDFIPTYIIYTYWWERRKTKNTAL